MTLALQGGFAAPSHDSARAFRAVLEALARPGRIERLDGAAPPAPLSPAAGALALVLFGPDTPVHLVPGHDTAAIRDWLAFHTGAPLVPAEEAAFAIGAWAALQPIARFRIGEAEYPDRSATLIVEMEALTATGPRLTGPGIAHEARLSLPETAAFRANRALFPLGFDTFLTAGDLVAGLPRSTIVEDV